MDLDEELIGEIAVEGLENLEDIEPLLLEIESDGVRDGDVWNTIFRGLHSIKGTAACAELTTIVELAHVSEGLLMQLRDGNLDFAPEMAAPLLDAVSRLRDMLQELPAPAPAAPPALLSKLAELTVGHVEAEGDAKEDEASEPPRLQEPVRYVVVAPPEGWDAARVASAAREVGEILAVPSAEDALLHVTTRLAPAELARALELPATQVHVHDPRLHPELNTGPEATVRFGDLAVELGFLSREALEDLLDRQSSTGEHRAIGRIARDSGLLTEEQADLIRHEQLLRIRTHAERAKTEASPAAPASETAQAAEAPAPETQAEASDPKPAKRKGSAKANTIRVGVPLLNKLIDLAGELVLGRNQLRQMLEGREVAGLKRVLQNLDNVTSELQESILYTRMQPVRVLLDRLPRQVRDTAAKLEKQVHLELTGGDVELDRSLIEALSDPMTHLIRNAVDHGIEEPATRREAGKDETGHITVGAMHSNGQVVIEIKDDGKGIDPARLRQLAVDRGIHTPEQAESLPDAEAIRLIFHPGLSTAKQVTDISGRGVGMDVVRSNIKALGGQVQVESTVGVGTTLRVRLPLTLAIIPTLIVGVDEHRFAIPQVNVLEVVPLREGDHERRIEEVRGVEVLHLRDRLLPLVRLDACLNISRKERSSRSYVVVLQSGDSSYGLILDRVVDSEEIVVKPLAALLSGCHWFAGSTILGDGEVVMILDAAGLARRYGLDLEEHGRAAAEGSFDAGDSQRVIVFENGPGERFALPQADIRRLERIRPQDLQVTGGREHFLHDGRAVPLMRLEHQLPVQGATAGLEEGFVLIPRRGDVEVGLFASSIIDTLEVNDPPERAALAAPGVNGSALLDGKLTLFLDIDRLLNAEDEPA